MWLELVLNVVAYKGGRIYDEVDNLIEKYERGGVIEKYGFHENFWEN